LRENYGFVVGEVGPELFQIRCLVPEIQLLGKEGVELGRGARRRTKGLAIREAKRRQIASAVL
jgi:hypothetical protein